MNLTRINVLVIHLILMVTGIACSHGQIGSVNDEEVSGNERVFTEHVGNNIGDIAPEFSILLTSGETISH